jgi:hypothetical protein
VTVSDLLILDTRGKTVSAEAAPAATGPRNVLAVTGVALAVVGWVDWLLLWVPLNFGSVEWEFGTIGQSFDALPLATIGTAALIAAAIGGGWRRTLVVTAGLAFAVAITLGLILAIFLLDIPILLEGAAGAVRPVLLKAVAKTSLYGLLYVTTYAWLGLACLRVVRRAPRGK